MREIHLITELSELFQITVSEVSQYVEYFSHASDLSQNCLEMLSPLLNTERQEARRRNILENFEKIAHLMRQQRYCHIPCGQDFRRVVAYVSD